MLKSDNEEYKDKRLTMFPTNLSSKTSDCSSKDETAFLPESFSFPNQSIKTPDNRSHKSILAPARFIIGGNQLELSNVNNSKSFISHSHAASDNDQDDKSEFSFKVPLPPTKKSSINNDVLPPSKKSSLNNYVAKEKTTTDDEGIKADSVEDCTKQNTVDTTELKKRLRSLMVIVEPKKRKSTICSCRWSFKFIVLLSIATACLACFLNTENFSKKFCSPRFEFGGISKDLKNRIYNQESAIDELTKYFRDKNNKTGFDVIALVGGIGVGKSYTAEIVRNRMKASGNIIDVFPPLINKEDEAYSSLSICRCNMIRLENLKTDDIPDAAAFADKLKRKASGYCILIIALFNTQETDEHLRKTLDLSKSISLIEQTFRERKLEATLISYRSMSSEALTKCIKDAADYSNVKLTNTDVENIRHDMLIADSGCKGVYAKVQLRSSSEL